QGKESALFRTVAAGELDISAIAALNTAQQAAVKKALSAEDIAIIHGPPGTGKTTTLVAIILAAVQRGESVLACAPSNMAVDNLAESLVKAGATLVRIGHPARVQPQLQAHTLDAQVEQHDNYRLAKKLRKQAQSLLSNARKWRRARPQDGEKAAMRQDAKQLQAEARALEARAVERVLDAVPIVLATLTALDSALLGQRQFDLCVIDEAGQSTEPALWIPLTRSRKVILAGDHRQLPPTIMSQQAQDEGFGISLLERLMLRDGVRISQQLVRQYRMHQQIMAFSSAEFYQNSLLADTSVATHLLADLPHVTANELTCTPIDYIDTAGASYDEEREPDGRSWQNPQEANLVIRKVTALLAAGVEPDVIGIITPYSAQTRLIRAKLQQPVEVNSVDGFQGREKEAIIISLVRSNQRGEVGFLRETRRMNVALTRARRKLIVIGDSGTISAEPFFTRLLDYWDTIGVYHSVWEEAVV
ncbi:MAG TPA: DNA-binding protein, partial [Anaerolineae bacterium]|nr:DNA-binding protein [Anaerolineae bacterium]